MQFSFIIDYLIKYNLNVTELLILSIRNIIPGDFSDRMKNYEKSMINLIKNNINYVLQNEYIIPLIFIKLLRIYLSHMLFTLIDVNEQNLIKNNIMEILKKIWSTKSKCNTK